MQMVIASSPVNTAYIWEVRQRLDSFGNSRKALIHLEDLLYMKNAVPSFIAPFGWSAALKQFINFPTEVLVLKDFM